MVGTVQADRATHDAGGSAAGSEHLEGAKLAGTADVDDIPWGGGESIALRLGQRQRDRERRHRIRRKAERRTNNLAQLVGDSSSRIDYLARQPVSIACNLP